jgi:calcineurin-like phosphoesterase family protein
MSYKKFLIADPHFGHWGVCKFLRSDGTKLRPWDNPDEMDEVLVQRWNETVRPIDTVYVLGDVAINRRCLPILSRLNGKKNLIKGNHDIFQMKDYVPHFKDIRAYHYIDGYMMSHIPIHTESLGRYKCNIHGHIHDREVLLPTVIERRIDARYLCVSVEHIDYTPIEWDAALERIRIRQEENLTLKRI